MDKLKLKNGIGKAWSQYSFIIVMFIVMIVYQCQRQLLQMEPRGCNPWFSEYLYCRNHGSWNGLGHYYRTNRPIHRFLFGIDHQCHNSRLQYDQLHSCDDPYCHYRGRIVWSYQRPFGGLGQDASIYRNPWNYVDL